MWNNISFKESSFIANESWTTEWNNTQNDWLRLLENARKEYWNKTHNISRMSELSDPKNISWSSNLNDSQDANHPGHRSPNPTESYLLTFGLIPASIVAFFSTLCNIYAACVFCKMARKTQCKRWAGVSSAI